MVELIVGKKGKGKTKVLLDKVNLLKIVILRKDTTDKSYKFICILNRESGYINKTYFIVEFIHMFCALV